MEKRENHLLDKVRETGDKSLVVQAFHEVPLGVGTEEAAENTLDFDTGGMHAERFQCRV
jgi:hypothetical protein